MEREVSIFYEIARGNYVQEQAIILFFSFV